MREIKFRVVFKHDIELGGGKLKKGLIFYQKQIGEELFFVMECDEKFRYPFEIPFIDDDWIKMQYTGLKDKSGVEIFEGDIVKGEYEERRVVEFDEDRGGFVPFANDGGCSCCSDDIAWLTRESIVIGNVYENPELLEGK